MLALGGGGVEDLDLRNAKESRANVVLKAS